VAVPPSKQQQPVANPTYAQYVLVRFKRSQYTYGHDGSLREGDVVVVEGDRGPHMGVVIDAHARRPKGFVAPIVRRATDEDISHLNEVRRQECMALAVCRDIARSLGLDRQMTLMDVEFQTDFGKLTVFFEPVDPGQFVDFRKLQRALFQNFRCRIWLVDF